MELMNFGILSAAESVCVCVCTMLYCSRVLALCFSVNHCVNWALVKTNSPDEIIISPKAHKKKKIAVFLCKMLNDVMAEY